MNKIVIKLDKQELFIPYLFEQLEEDLRTLFTKYNTSCTIEDSITGNSVRVDVNE